MIVIGGMTVTGGTLAIGPGIGIRGRRRMCIVAGIAAAFTLGTITAGIGTGEPGSFMM